MKILSVAICLLLTFSSVRAQLQTDTSEALRRRSNAELFADSAGRLIESSYHSYGHVTSCTIALVVFRDVMTGKRVSAVQFNDNNNNTTFLDSDEFEPLRVAMTAVNEQILTTNPSDYTEVTFNSRAGLRIGCFHDKGAWQFFIQVKRDRLNSFLVIKKADFDVFLQILNNIRSKGSL